MKIKKAKVRKNITRLPKLDLSKITFALIGKKDHGMTGNLPCFRCKEKIGNRSYKIGWVKEVGKPEYSIRFCETCGKSV